jgi:23S rRNA maturation mini-RNase III
MNHSIKVNRARKLARFLPRADAEIQASIPEELIESLTAKQLARVRRALNEHWHKAVAHTEASIVGEGCVWSERHGKLLEIQFPEAK